MKMYELTSQLKSMTLQSPSDISDNNPVNDNFISNATKIRTHL